MTSQALALYTPLAAVARAWAERSPSWRRLHRPIAERTPQLRADPQKYRHMVIPTVVRASVISPRLDVTLAAVEFLRRPS
jgi:hypothetical protein